MVYNLIVRFNRNLSSFIILFAIVIGGFLYFSAKQQIPQSVSISPTSVPTNTITDTSLNSGKCHAVHVDPSDPQAFLPDSSCTPGEIDTTVTQDDIATTICHSGYTQTVGPPVSYTNSLKEQQIADYGYEDTTMSDYEEDHFISLELGGSPKDPRNLWPEPHPSTNEKDTVENYLHAQVCSGKLTLVQAQQEITKNWYEVYKEIH